MRAAGGAGSAADHAADRQEEKKRSGASAPEVAAGGGQRRWALQLAPRRAMVMVQAAGRRLRTVRSHLSALPQSADSPRRPAAAVPAAEGAVMVPHTAAAAAAAAVDPAELRLPSDGLFRPGWERAFDGSAWERDGVLVLPGVLTDTARELWLASLQRLQRISDTIVCETPWADCRAWAPLGLVPTRPPLSSADKARLCGGCEISGPDGGFFPPGYEDLPFEQKLRAPVQCGEGVQWQGFFPAEFPLAYDGFAMHVACHHPQFLALQRRLLTAPEQGRHPPRLMRLDHSLLLNRKGGSDGRRWHAHEFDGRDSPKRNLPGEPFCDAAALVAGPRLMLARTLCYPAGISAEHGGLLGVIPGASLFRDPFCCGGNRTAWDRDMQEGWLRSKRHPVTGEPLRIVNHTLPPGSLLCFPHHMPHSVTPRTIDAPTRWAQLLTYRTIDESEPVPSGYGQAASDSSWDWAEHATRRGSIGAQAATMLRWDFNRRESG